MVQLVWVQLCFFLTLIHFKWFVCLFVILSSLISSSSFQFFKKKMFMFQLLLLLFINFLMLNSVCLILYMHGGGGGGGLQRVLQMVRIWLNRIGEPLPFKHKIGTILYTTHITTFHVLLLMFTIPMCKNTTQHIAKASFMDLVTVAQENSNKQTADVLVEGQLYYSLELITVT